MSWHARDACKSGVQRVVSKPTRDFAGFTGSTDLTMSTAARGLYLRGQRQSRRGSE